MANEVYSSLTQFTSDLYSEVALHQTSEMNNVFMSSLSIYMALLMTLLGTDGETKTELRKSLHIPLHLEGDELHDSFGRTLLNHFVDSADFNLSLANRLFIFRNLPLRMNFRKSLERSYSTHVERLPESETLESKLHTVNDRVSEETNSRITEFLSEGALSDEDVMALVNAIHFKGLWRLPFTNQSTEHVPFVKLNGTEVDVPMMFLEEELPYEDIFYSAAEAIKLPFGNSLWELLIILPYEQNGLPDLLEEFQNNGTLASILAKPFAKTKLYLHLPRFKLTERVPMDIKELLVNMGMKSLFDETADFSAMSSDASLFLSDLKHKAVFETDVKPVKDETTHTVLTGTESANGIDIRVDHPFIVALIYNGTVPAFVGHVVEPEVV